MPKHTPQKSSLDLEPHQVLLRPLVTEKGVQSSADCNAYAFQVNRLATKSDVRRAVEQLFDVKVMKVATQNRRGKTRRGRQGMGRTADWKKAVVTLHDEHRIEFF